MLSLGSRPVINSTFFKKFASLVLAFLLLSLLVGLFTPSQPAQARTASYPPSSSLNSSSTLLNPWQDTDIGSAALSGSTSQTSPTDFTLNGGGGDIWGNSDTLHYVYRPLVGDGSIIAQVASQAYSSPWAKAGVMIRESLDPSSTQASRYGGDTRQW
jgi:hypothetical protein